MKNTTNILNKYVILEATQENINTCIRHIKADKKELNFKNLFEYLNYYVFELGFLNNYKAKNFRIKNIYDIDLLKLYCKSTAILKCKKERKPH